MDTEFLDKNIDGNGLVITDQSRAYLTEVAKWGKFLAIVGFISIAFMVVAGIIMSLFMGTAMDSLDGAGAMGFMSGTFLSMFYIVFALIYIMPILYLYRFSNKLKLALVNDNQEVLQESIMNLKSLFKFMGVFTMIILVLYAVLFLIGMVGAIFAG